MKEQNLQEKVINWRTTLDKSNDMTWTDRRMDYIYDQHHCSMSDDVYGLISFYANKTNSNEYKTREPGE